jgi:hypothetical protein
MKTTLVHASNENEVEIFSRLVKGIEEKTLQKKDVVNGVFQAVRCCTNISTIDNMQLVGGPFDMESKFIIQSPTCINRLVCLTDICDDELQVRLQ